MFWGYKNKLAGKMRAKIPLLCKRRYTHSFRPSGVRNKFSPKKQKRKTPKQFLSSIASNVYSEAFSASSETQAFLAMLGSLFAAALNNAIAITDDKIT
jgi:hypothetical protein